MVRLKRNSFRSKSKLLLNVICLLTISTFSSFAAPETIIFPHQNVSDLRGLLNVFQTFRKACLEHTIDETLPEKLRPEGYKIVSFFEFVELDAPKNAKNLKNILSKTGTEQGDWDGGHPYVTFGFSEVENTEPECSVSWQRDWDYEDGIDDIAFGMNGVLDAQISYYLAAILRSAPNSSITRTQSNFGGVSDWITFCPGRKPCGFTVVHSFDHDNGVNISITKQPIQR